VHECWSGNFLYFHDLFLQLSQEKLQETAEGTLKKLEDGQNRIAAKQRMLTDEQAIVHTRITENLQELKQEQSDIVSGNQQIVRMTESISLKLGQFVIDLCHLLLCFINMEEMCLLL